MTHTLGAGFGRVFAPEASRTREKARFLPAFPVDPGGSPGGRTLARAVMHSICFAQSAALQRESRPVWRGGGGPAFGLSHPINRATVSGRTPLPSHLAVNAFFYPAFGSFRDQCVPFRAIFPPLVFYALDLKPNASNVPDDSIMPDAILAQGPSAAAGIRTF